MTSTPPRPRSVIDWYTDAIAVLEHCRQRVEATSGPIVQRDLTEAVRLSKELVRIYETDNQ